MIAKSLLTPPASNNDRSAVGIGGEARPSRLFELIRSDRTGYTKEVARPNGGGRGEPSSGVLGSVSRSVVYAIERVEAVGGQTLAGCLSEGEQDGR